MNKILIARSLSDYNFISCKDTKLAKSSITACGFRILLLQLGDTFY
jgi:hypothetical protein